MKIMRLYFFLIFCLLSLPVSAAQSEDAFFSDLTLLSVAMSPNGERLATVISHGEKQSIVLVDTNTGKKSEEFDFNDLTKNNASLSSASWIDSHTLAIQYSEVREGVLDLVDTQSVATVLIVPLKPGLAGHQKTLSVRTAGWILDALPSVEGEFLYAKSGLRSSIYRLKVAKLYEHQHSLGKLERMDGGQFTRSNAIAEIDAYALRWFLAEDGSATAALHFTEEGGLALSNLRTPGSTSSKAKPKVVKEWPKEEKDEKSDKEDADANTELEKKLIPVALSDTADYFYALDSNEEVRRSIYLVNYKDPSVALVYETGGDKIAEIILHPTKKTMIGAVEVRNGKFNSVFFAQESKDQQHSVKTRSNWQFDSEIEVSVDGSRTLRYQESHNIPGRYYVDTPARSRTQLVASVHPGIRKPLKSRQVSATVNSQGIEIEYLLNMPTQKSNAPYSLIVMPHGGPFGVYDSGYFDLETQHLVARGFAVLRTNFRGSGGYGAEFGDAGKGQWGKLMLDDIHAATGAVVQRPDINAQRVCIFGFSYGGYAATALLLRNPETFACGVSVAGVSDLNLLIQRTGLNENLRKWYREYLGDPAESYTDLEEISTTHNIHNLQRPLLLIHGGIDETVDQEHSWRLKRILDKHAIKYSWQFYPDVGHQIKTSAELAEIYGAVTNFILQHLADGSVEKNPP